MAGLLSALQRGCDGKDATQEREIFDCVMTAQTHQYWHVVLLINKLKAQYS
jgi:hypothetical protein